MGKYVNVRESGKGFDLSFNHPLADRANGELLASCFDELFACAEKNGCLDGRVSLTEPCLQTIARHNEATKCIASCFGCA